MILDTSVIVAIALREPGYEEARLTNHPLLFVGDDFSRTDIQVA